jgi:hypothetical protein
LLVAARASDDDAVQRGVDLAVAAVVEPVALRVAGARGDRRDAGDARKLCRRGEAPRAGDLADELGGDQRPEARLGEQWWRDLSTSAVISRSSWLTVWVSSRRRRSMSRAMRTRIVCSARAKRPPILVDPFFENNAPPGTCSSGQRSCRCQSSVLLSSTRWRTRRSR